MAPLHDWKDDAEFIRYNVPEAPRWPTYRPWLAILGCCIGIAVCWYGIFTQLGVINRKPERIVENMVAYDQMRPELLKRDQEINNELQHAEPVQ